MNSLTATFSSGGVSGVMRRNKRRTPLRRAEYYRTFAELYPELNVSTSGYIETLAKIADAGDKPGDDPAALDAVHAILGLTPDQRLSMERVTSVNEFIQVAAYLDEVIGIDLPAWEEFGVKLPARALAEFPRASDKVTVRRVYEYLLDNDDLFDAMLAAIETLENPNGDAGAAPGALTEVQRAELDQPDSPLAVSGANGRAN